MDESRANIDDTEWSMWLYAKIIEVKNYTDTKYLIIFGKRLNWDPLGYAVIFQKIGGIKMQVGYG